MTRKSLFLLLVLCYLHIEKAVGYVEAVSANVNLSQEELEMQVATYCDKNGASFHNQYMDRSGNWVSDLENKNGCLKTHEEALEYCQLTYPGFHFARTAQSSHSYMISDWCKVGHKKCKGSFWVKPYKCVQADDEHSSDLSVPKSCKLDHIQDDSNCQASHSLSMDANKACKDSGMQLDSYATYQPCGHDKFTQIEFVCCPANAGKSKLPRKTSNSSETLLESNVFIDDATSGQEIDVETSTRDPYFTKFDPRSEHDAFKAAERRLEASHRRKITKIMKEWTDLEERYQKLKIQNPQKADKFKLKMTERFNRMMNALKDQGLAEKHQLVDLHQQRIIAHITERKKDSMKCFVKSLNERPPSASLVKRCLNHLIRALFKDRHHTISHFNHKTLTDPSGAQSEVRATIGHLHDISRMLNESLQMLDHYPDVRSAILPEMLTLREELQQRDVLPAQLQEAAEWRQEVEEEPSPAHGAWGEDVAENRIDIDVEVERHPAALSEQQLEPRVAHAESHQHAHAEASFEVRASSPAAGGGRGAYVTLALLSLALTAALVAGVVTARRRRSSTPGRAGFVQVDQTVSAEERHVAQMQVNGYENPTYRYFESK